MALAVIILSLASASGQGAYTVVRNSQVKYQVPANAEVQTYEWKVYTNTDLDLEANASTECKITPVDGEPNAITIKWLDNGDYYLTLYATGFNGCTNIKAWKYSVVSTPSIAFAQLESSDCADDNNSFATALVAKFDTDTDLSESQYPLTVTYRITGDTEDKTAEIKYAGKMLNVVGIIENEISETKNYISIISATNKYGGILNMIPGEETHTRTIFALPAKPIITINN